MASPTPTLPDNDTEGKDPYNPGDRLTDEKMRTGYTSAGIDQAESFANDPANASEEIDKQERDGSVPPDTNFDSSYSGKKNSSGKILSGSNVRAILKKRGPLGLIAILGLGGGLVGTLLFSPGILLVQMKEMLVDRFNYQLAGMETRSNIILNKKISSDFTSGVCTNPLSIRCKYSTISNKQAERLKLAGIDIEDGSQKIGNRIKPGTIKWQGETIDARDFNRKFNSDPNFRAAMRKAYNPRFAGFADSVWAKVSSRIGISKVRALPDGDDATKAQAIQDQAKDGRRISVVPDDGIDCPSDGGNCTRRNGGGELTEAESDAARATKAAAVAGLEEAIESTVGAADEAIAEGTEIIKTTTDVAIGGVANFLKVTGGADIACQAYTAVRGLGYAAKTVRALQLARYAMVFLNTADQIKEGTAKAEDVAYLGGILTNIAYNVKSGAQRKAAMDSFGMQYASYGTMGGYNNTYVSQFMAGGGLTGDLINVTNWINAQLPGGARQTCAILSNGFVQLGSVAAGVALLLIPGVNVVVGAADIAKAIGSVAASVGLAILPDLMKDIVAGTVTEGIVGEDSGNAIASGASTTMSQLAAERGAPLTVDQAVAYQGVHNETLALYAEEERATLSPLDATSRNTFVGSMISQIVPYAGSVSSVATLLSSTPKFFGNALSSLVPKSSATTAEEARIAFSSCNDPDYVEYLEIATDPFCNPIYGIPTEYIEKDPITVAEELIAGGHISEEGVPVSDEYKKFITNCINRTTPLGDNAGVADGSDGMECKIDTATKANFYLFNLDGTIEEGMDGYASENGGGSESKQALAQKIVAKGNVTYLGDIQPALEGIADGSINPDDEPCGINLYILKVIDIISDTYSMKISDINRHCTDSLAGGRSSSASRHYAGNGSAIDIAVIDGRVSTGRDANSLAALALIMPTLAEAATAAASYSGIGQSECGGSLTLGSGVIEFDDFCDHLHIEVPPTADPALKYSQGKAI